MSEATHNGEWTLLDAQGGTAVAFTSFIELDVTNSGQVTSYPVEEGGFINYNKTQSPLEIRVTLGFQGSNSDFERVLAQLDEYRREAVTLAVSTPSALYESMTLQSFSYKRGLQNNAGMLVTELNLTEVRQVAPQSYYVALNPTSSAKVKTGKTQTKKCCSILRMIFGCSFDDKEESATVGKKDGKSASKSGAKTAGKAESKEDKPSCG